MKHCAHCGRQNPEDAKYCTECGTSEFVAPKPSRLAVFSDGEEVTDNEVWEISAGVGESRSLPIVKGRLLRIVRVTLVIAGCWFLVFTAFVARPTPMMQFLSLLLTLALLVFGFMGFVRIITCWHRDRFRRRFPLPRACLRSSSRRWPEAAFIFLSFNGHCLATNRSSAKCNWATFQYPRCCVAFHRLRTD